jgi:hypothetical protein
MGRRVRLVGTFSLFVEAGRVWEGVASAWALQCLLLLSER